MKVTDLTRAYLAAYRELKDAQRQDDTTEISPVSIAMLAAQRAQERRKQHANS